jgi:hypothetical protein
MTSLSVPRVSETLLHTHRLSPLPICPGTVAEMAESGGAFPLRYRPSSRNCLSPRNFASAPDVERSAREQDFPGPSEPLMLELMMNGFYS